VQNGANCKAQKISKNIKTGSHKNVVEFHLHLPQDLVLFFLVDCYHLSYLLLARQSCYETFVLNIFFQNVCPNICDSAIGMDLSKHKKTKKLSPWSSKASSGWWFSIHVWVW